MADPRTMFDKIWDQHAILTREDGQSLLWIDRHYLHEGSFHAFDTLARRALGVARPELAVAVADHYVPTRGSAPPAMAEVIARLTANTAAHGIRLFGQGDPRQGIVHVTGPERGLTLPGMTVVCGDSHTSTHGAMGALAFGIGASEVAHVLATQTLWQRRPRRMRVTVGGQLAPGVTAKDLALTLIARLGSDGGRGHAIEYAGPAVRALSMEGRLTLCNMTIECGARCGMIAPDEVTRAWLQAEWQTDWTTLATDPGAAFDREVTLDAIDVAPTVTWGTNPEDGLPIDAFVPDPAALEAPRAAHVREALDYMGLRPGQALAGLAVDRVFIGSCTNGRIEDLRAAAAVLAGRRAVVPGLVSPGSAAVKAQAEREGIDRIVLEAGLEWGEAGCSMCVGMNGDVVVPGQRCASTTNRNFRGRQGPGARTHLMSPAMAATAAVMGQLSDVRNLARPLADRPRAPNSPPRAGGKSCSLSPCGRGSG